MDSFDSDSVGYGPERPLSGMMEHSADTDLTILTSVPTGRASKSWVMYTLFEKYLADGCTQLLRLALRTLHEYTVDPMLHTHSHELFQRAVRKLYDFVLNPQPIDHLCKSMVRSKYHMAWFYCYCLLDLPDDEHGFLDGTLQRGEIHLLQTKADAMAALVTAFEDDADEVSGSRGAGRGTRTRSDNENTSRSRSHSPSSGTPHGSVDIARQGSENRRTSAPRYSASTILAAMGQLASASGSTPSSARPNQWEVHSIDPKGMQIVNKMHSFTYSTQAEMVGRLGFTEDEKSYIANALRRHPGLCGLITSQMPVLRGIAKDVFKELAEQPSEVAAEAACDLLMVVGDDDWLAFDIGRLIIDQGVGQKINEIHAMYAYILAHGTETVAKLQAYEAEELHRLMSDEPHVPETLPEIWQTFFIRSVARTRPMSEYMLGDLSILVRTDPSLKQVTDLIQKSPLHESIKGLFWIFFIDDLARHALDGHGTLSRLQTILREWVPPRGLHRIEYGRQRAAFTLSVANSLLGLQDNNRWTITQLLNGIIQNGVLSTMGHIMPEDIPDAMLEQAEHWAEIEAALCAHQNHDSDRDDDDARHRDSDTLKSFRLLKLIIDRMTRERDDGPVPHLTEAIAGLEELLLGMHSIDCVIETVEVILTLVYLPNYHSTAKDPIAQWRSLYNQGIWQFFEALADILEQWQAKTSNVDTRGRSIRSLQSAVRDIMQRAQIVDALTNVPDEHSFVSKRIRSLPSTLQLAVEWPILLKALAWADLLDDAIEDRGLWTRLVQESTGNDELECIVRHLQMHSMLEKDDDLFESLQHILRKGAVAEFCDAVLGMHFRGVLQPQEAMIIQAQVNQYVSDISKISTRKERDQRSTLDFLRDSIGVSPPRKPSIDTDDISDRVLVLQKVVNLALALHSIETVPDSFSAFVSVKPTLLADILRRQGRSMDVLEIKRYQHVLQLFAGEGDMDTLWIDQALAFCLGDLDWQSQHGTASIGSRFVTHIQDISNRHEGDFGSPTKSLSDMMDTRLEDQIWRLAIVVADEATARRVAAVLHKTLEMVIAESLLVHYTEANALSHGGLHGRGRVSWTDPLNSSDPDLVREAFENSGTLDPKVFVNDLLQELLDVVKPFIDYDDELESQGYGVLCLEDRRRIRLRQEYVLFVQKTAGLVSVDLSVLSPGQRPATYINLYLLMMLHAYISSDTLPVTSLEVLDYLQSTGYTMSGLGKLTAWEIDVYLLRINMRVPLLYGMTSVDRSSQPKRAALLRRYAIDSAYPLLSFALNFGCLDAPPLRLYESSTLRDQLSDNAKLYLTRTVRVSTKFANPRQRGFFFVDMGRADIALPRVLWSSRQDITSSDDIRDLILFVERLVPNSDMAAALKLVRELNRPLRLRWTHSCHAINDIPITASALSLDDIENVPSTAYPEAFNAWSPVSVSMNERQRALHVLRSRSEDLGRFFDLATLSLNREDLTYNEAIAEFASVVSPGSTMTRYVSQAHLYVHRYGRDHYRIDERLVWPASIAPNGAFWLADSVGLVTDRLQRSIIAYEAELGKAEAALVFWKASNLDDAPNEELLMTVFDELAPGDSLWRVALLKARTKHYAAEKALAGTLDDMPRTSEIRQNKDMYRALMEILDWDVTGEPLINVLDRIVVEDQALQGLEDTNPKPGVFFLDIWQQSPRIARELGCQLIAAGYGETLQRWMALDVSIDPTRAAIKPLLDALTARQLLHSENAYARWNRLLSSASTKEILEMSVMCLIETTEHHKRAEISRHLLLSGTLEDGRQVSGVKKVLKAAEMAQWCMEYLRDLPSLGLLGVYLRHDTVADFLVYNGRFADVLQLLAAHPDLKVHIIDEIFMMLKRCWDSFITGDSESGSVHKIANHILGIPAESSSWLQRRRVYSQTRIASVQRVLGDSIAGSNLMAIYRSPQDSCINCRRSCVLNADGYTCRECEMPLCEVCLQGDHSSGAAKTLPLHAYCAYCLATADNSQGGSSLPIRKTATETQQAVDCRLMDLADDLFAINFKDHDPFRIEIDASKAVDEDFDLWFFTGVAGIDKVTKDKYFSRWMPTRRMFLQLANVLHCIGQSNILRIFAIDNFPRQPSLQIPRRRTHGRQLNRSDLLELMHDFSATIVAEGTSKLSEQDKKFNALKTRLDILFDIETEYGPDTGLCLRDLLSPTNDGLQRALDNAIQHDVRHNVCTRIRRLMHDMAADGPQMDSQRFLQALRVRALDEAFFFFDRAMDQIEAQNLDVSEFLPSTRIMEELGVAFFLDLQVGHADTYIDQVVLYMRRIADTLTLMKTIIDWKCWDKLAVELSICKDDETNFAALQHLLRRDSIWEFLAFIEQSTVAYGSTMSTLRKLAHTCRSTGLSTVAMVLSMTCGDHVKAFEASIDTFLRIDLTHYDRILQLREGRSFLDSLRSKRMLEAAPGLISATEDLAGQNDDESIEHMLAVTDLQLRICDVSPMWNPQSSHGVHFRRSRVQAETSQGVSERSSLANRLARMVVGSSRVKPYGGGRSAESNAPIILDRESGRHRACIHLLKLCEYNLATEVVEIYGMSMEDVVVSTILSFDLSRDLDALSNLLIHFFDNGRNTDFVDKAVLSAIRHLMADNITKRQRLARYFTVYIREPQAQLEAAIAVKNMRDAFLICKERLHTEEAINLVRQAARKDGNLALVENCDKLALRHGIRPRR
eukprot:Clim_evm14s225 gene=Clim_evmTU14s225